MIPETVLFARIRAAYRVRAVSAAVCVGASVFALGAGVGIPLCLNAAYLAALAALPAAGLTALLARRVLVGAGRFARARHALISLTLLALALFAFAATVSLVHQTLLPLARISFVAQVSFLFAGLCCATGAQGAPRMTFALRGILPVGLAALSLSTLSFETAAGLFPLLGTGARNLGLSALCMIAAAAPALLIALPPPELKDVPQRERATPGAWFFVWRVMLGAALGVGLLMVLSLCSTYEGLAAQQTWGRRMLIFCQREPHEGLGETILTLLQALSLLLCAIHGLLGAAQAWQAVWPRLGRGALGGCLLVCALLLTALVVAGVDIARRVAPLLGAPVLLVWVLCLGRRKKP